VAVGLAKLYSEVVGAETRMRQAVSRSQLRSMGGSAVAVGFGVGDTFHRVEEST
jgi:hypothetical protein